MDNSLEANGGRNIGMGQYGKEISALSIDLILLGVHFMAMESKAWQSMGFVWTLYFFVVQRQWSFSGDHGARMGERTICFFSAATGATPWLLTSFLEGEPRKLNGKT